MKPNETVWGTGSSPDGDWDGTFDTRMEAIENGLSEYREPFWICSGRAKAPSEYLDISVLWERMSENTADDGAPDSSDFPDVPTDKEKELVSYLEAWVDAHIETDFWIADSEPERIDPATWKGEP